jgi:PAS domain S-box-containing protein
VRGYDRQLQNALYDGAIATISTRISLPNARQSDVDPPLLETILEGTAAETGEQFFAALVRSLTFALKVDGAWVTEYLQGPKRLRALSFWWRDRYVEDFEYDIRDSPCEQVVEKKDLLRYSENIVQLFPRDAELVALNATAYMGMPLLDEHGSVLGHLAVIDSKPLPDDPRLEAIFRIFAVRASAEVRRIRAELAVRESEERFWLLFESALDAIVELTRTFSIVRLNRAACDTFGIGDGATGRSFLHYLTTESANKLRTFVRNLDESGQSSLWVSAGLEACREDGSSFPVEASLSRFQLRDERRYTLILRNVRDQIEAERRIAALTRESEYLQEEIGFNFGEILGSSRPCQQMLNSIHQVGPTDTTVLIQGETGTGKELVARAIHRASRRSTKPLIKVNCAAIPAPLIESEFFGHEKGAFTGATQRRIGRFGLADGGTMFLDEIGELSLDLQAKLLRVLQEGEFDPVGSSQPRKVDVRVIAATNKDLRSEVNAGRFREDLYYRLNVFPIPVPPLRERADDIAILAEAFVRSFSTKVGKAPMDLTLNCLRKLRAYHWPGNIRELQNVVERAMIVSPGSTLNFDGILPQPKVVVPMPEPSPPRTAGELRELERANILQALERSKWKISGEAGAARLLELAPSTLTSRMKALGIRRPR